MGIAPHIPHRPQPRQGWNTIGTGVNPCWEWVCDNGTPMGWHIVPAVSPQSGLTDFKFDGVQYVNGHPDFEKYSLGKVEINFYSNNRDYNFRQARELMAKQLNERHPNGVKMKNGKNRPYRASDVKKYMEDMRK